MPTMESEQKKKIPELIKFFLKKEEQSEMEEKNEKIKQNNCKSEPERPIGLAGMRIDK